MASTKWVLAGAGLVTTLVACGGATDHGIPTTSSSSSSSSSSSGSTSSSGGSTSSSSGSTSGGLVYTTTCLPELADHFFDGAPQAPIANTRAKAPCPNGMVPLPSSTLFGTAPPPPPRRFSTAKELADTYCTTGGDDPGAGAPIDFATHDVIAVVYKATSPSPPTAFTVEGNIWMRTDDQQCEGGAPSHIDAAFYVVDKAQQLQVQACTTTCGCVGENCEPGFEG